MRAARGFAILIVALTACTTAVTHSGDQNALRYVALGDSYTIGTSVSADESWPSQLSSRVAGLRLIANLGVNGFTSQDLIDDELPALPGLRPEFATLLIGVNDVVQGVSLESYRANVAAVLDRLLGQLPAIRIVCIATPDYTVTPQGAAFGSPDQRAGILQVNRLLGEACEARGIRFVPDIFEISEAAATDRSLVAGDGLHPSGAQYALWVNAIQPVVEDLLLPSPDR